ncbi:hypothetical protein Skr01_57180 [Sphaerisporangium krabiense]|uniref:Plasmid replication, integration and excision activator n=1 Tax=Sphaerisporangium krabiense TaxID=763782 RepID=A0A7W9DTK7_9ACTN|nr:hypothetical protein [Sphaerisporangium krabiense]MBB5629515.1 hypothetical protein [Sphaerisporangium krabiense]GII65633.1 hypothetical protein Skr01_57180 [Sphaerisporangium krabiense]
MRNIPVDIANLAFIVAGEPEAKLADRDTGEIKTDREGRELYTIPLLPKPNDDRRNPVITVTFPSVDFPKIPEGIQVRPVGLSAFYWSMNGRSGMGFRCEAIRPVNAPANGSGNGPSS